MFQLFGKSKKLTLPTQSEALPGRQTPIQPAPTHLVLGTPTDGPWPGGEVTYFALGCFWGAERLFWKIPGVLHTSVGYQGGLTPNPTYREVCTGLTGHTEVVRVVFDPSVVSYDELLRAFWEAHDPTQGMRQGNDVGTQYRSALYTTSPQQEALALASARAYEAPLLQAGQGRITTEIKEAPPYYLAEDEHQQYLHKNPGGYCGLKGTGVSCPLDFGDGQ